jgi:uncharacterized protein involved in outer membrane biogenesis
MAVRGGRDKVVNRRRIATVVAVCLVTGLALLATILFDVDRYRPQLISFLEAKTGKNVEIGHLTVTFFPHASIRLDDFRVKSPPLFPPSYIVKVTRADARVDLWALLHRHLVITSLVLEAPEINLVSDPDGPWNFENPNVAHSSNILPEGRIEKVVITGGQLIASNLLPSDAQGPVFLEAHDISCELGDVDLAAIVNPASVSMNGQGTWKAGRFRIGRFEATNVNSNIRIESRGVLFSGAMAEAYGGKATGSFSVNLATSNATFRMDARISHVSVTRLLAEFPNARGRMTGTLDGDVTLAGDFAHTTRPLAGIRGSGHLKVTNGEVPPLMLNANLMKLMHFNDQGPAKEHPSSFASISTDFELANLRISSQSVDIDGYGVDVDGSGSVSVSGSDELNYRGVAVVTTKQGFFTNLVARVEGVTVKDGRMSFPFRLEGTIEDPKFLR